MHDATPLLIAMIDSMEDTSASQQIDEIIKMHSNWKGDLLVQLRRAIKQADPAVLEEIKWRMRTRPEGLAVWSHNGILCFAEIWKDNIKLLFPKGAHLQDPKKLFNARLESKTNRAIEFRENDKIGIIAFKALILEAVQLNTLKTSKE